MVLDENNQKWACTSCVRGHRSAKCGHTDRWLVAVKPSGRPRTSGCDHPNPDNCDCLGIRKVLMVAIPNDKKCTCTGDHTCYKGKLLHTARVTKEEETPDIPHDILQKRNSINEAYRAGGLPYAAQLFPDFFSSLPIASSANVLTPPSIQSAAGSKTQVFPLRPDGSSQVPDGYKYTDQGFKSEVIMQTTIPGPASSNALVNIATNPSTCCGQGKPEVSEQALSPSISAGPFQTFNMQHQLYSDGTPASNIGSFAHPWRADDFNQSIFQQQMQAQQAHGPAPYLDSFNCQCGEGCECTGCLAHPYNPSMQQEVGSLVPLMAHDGAAPSQVGESYNFPLHQGYQHPALRSPEALDQPSLMSPTHPAFIDSSNFSHFEYEVPHSSLIAADMGVEEPYDFHTATPEQHIAMGGLGSRTAKSCCDSSHARHQRSLNGEQDGEHFPRVNQSVQENTATSPTPYHWTPNASLYQ